MRTFLTSFLMTKKTFMNSKLKKTNSKGHFVKKNNDIKDFWYTKINPSPIWY